MDKLQYKLRAYVLKRAKSIGYLESLMELIVKGYDINDIAKLKKDSFILSKLTEECENKKLIKKSKMRRAF